MYKKQTTMQNYYYNFDFLQKKKVAASNPPNQKLILQNYILQQQALLKQQHEQYLSALEKVQEAAAAALAAQVVSEPSHSQRLALSSDSVASWPTAKTNEVVESVEEKVVHAIVLEVVEAQQLNKLMESVPAASVVEEEHIVLILNEEEQPSASPIEVTLPPTVVEGTKPKHSIRKYTGHVKIIGKHKH